MILEHLATRTILLYLSVAQILHKCVKEGLFSVSFFFYQFFASEYAIEECRQNVIINIVSGIALIIEPNVKSRLLNVVLGCDCNCIQYSAHSRFKLIAAERSSVDRHNQSRRYSRYVSLMA